jgi:hypothetical protein
MITVSATIQIAAAPQSVWAVLTDLGGYRNGTRYSRRHPGRSRSVNGSRCGASSRAADAG